ncbi:hypothetical protein BIY24_03920 [Halobacteriovorax marinus]|uniref:DUF1365 domain-containing protein n=1 Tax=Halobacteriovorax marinus TaxID=97084 RepID=UPI000BC35CD7|nr:DUF1365 domain-containing protein [Halobacteriovorax marinus]ATH07114.1 hypothetical protein BIY24_03920 [Halobacteriovorax marinus]
MKSNLYYGEVTHHRTKESKHHFSYRMYTHLIDLDELEDVKRELPFYCKMRRKDYIGNPNKSIKSEVQRIVREKGGPIINGPVRMLTQIRLLGVCFNPVTFYYCFDKNDENLEVILAEIENTPWGERYSYLVKEITNRNGLMRKDFQKEFHVSPFFPMDINYNWSFSSPSEELKVNMISTQRGKTVFSANMNLKHAPFNKRELIKHHLKYPLITYKIIFGIYLQAFILWMKGVTFYSHPNESNQRKMFFFKGDN